LGWIVADVTAHTSKAGVLEIGMDILAFCSSEAKAERIAAALIAAGEPEA